MNDYYAGYDEKYPDLIIKILEYFDISNNADLPVAKKSVIGFCEKYQEKEGKGSSFIYQPNIVDRICRRLCECNQITCIKNDGYKIIICLFLTKVTFLKRTKDG